MARSTVEVELLAEVTKARKAVDKFASDTQSQLNGISFNTVVSAISDGFTLIDRTAGSAFRAISGYLRDSVNEAIEAEKANTQLAQSMKLVGDFTEEAAASFDSLATELAKSTSFTDDQVIAASALAKAFKLTNSEAQQVVRAASELSAVTGRDLNSSVEVLAKTFNGLVSKELKQLVPELKNLSKAQLENGEAISLVLSRYRGTAETLNDTFGGALGQVTKAFGELSEAIGKNITQSETNKKILKESATLVNGLADSVNNLKEKNVELVTSASDYDIIFNKSAILETAQAIEKVEENLTSLIDEQKKAARAGQSQKILADIQKENDERIKQERKRVNESLKVEQEFGAISKSIRFAGLSDLEKLEKEAQEKIKTIRDAARLGIDTEGLDLKKAEADVRVQLEKDTLKLIEEANKQSFENRKKLISDAAATPIKAILELSAKGAIDKGAAIAIGAGLVANVAKGAQGAASLVSQGLGAIADTLLPGIGGAVSEIVNLLSQGPEKVRETVREFAKALPDVIEAVVTAIPVLIEELVNAVPAVIEKLVESAPKVIDALVASTPSLITAVVTQLPKVATELAKLMPFVAFQFSAELIKNIPQIVFQISQGIFNAMIQIVNSIFNYVVDFLNSLNPFDGEGGGFLGLAEGGRVPNVSRFQGDRFPARLDAGEQVLSRDLSSRLEDFLNGNGGGGGGQPLQINLNIGLEQFAKVMLEADRLGYRVRA